MSREAVLIFSWYLWGGVGQEGGRRKKQEGVSGIKKQLEESQ